jgi:hypothetical protein
MDNTERLAVYRAQTENVRTLNQAREQIKQAINYAIRKGNLTSRIVQTKVFALVFCAWVEANFSKVIHTPYGFTLDEIRQIKEVYQSVNLEAGWKKCIELAVRKISNPRRSNYIPNIERKIHSLIDEYVVAPSQIRNKIAHGQWAKALNSRNTKENNTLTKELEALDVVVISKWFRVHEHLLNIIESLIESPNRAFHRDYWKQIAELEEFLKESKSWSIDEKIKKLQKKPILRPQKD